MRKTDVENIKGETRGNMTELPILPAFSKNNVAITMQSSDFFAPYASVTIRSILDHITDGNNYDFIITSKDMSEDSAATLCSMADPYSNVSIRVVNVKKIYDQLIQVEDKRFGGETVTRIFLMELLPDYDKVLNLDSDMIVCADVAELYATDITDYYMAAVQDFLVYKHYHLYESEYFNRKFVHNVLKLDRIEQYCNGGLFLLNLGKIRENFTSRQIAQGITEKNFNYFEQDAFNFFFRNKVKYLDASWNWQFTANGSLQNTFGQYYDPSGYKDKFYAAAKHPKIIHYVADCKPWSQPKSELASLWWNCAQNSPFYRVIEDRLLNIQRKPTDRILIVCETAYHLYNAIQIVYTRYKNTNVDLLLTQTRNLHEYHDAIEQTGLFQKIILSSWNLTRDLGNIHKQSVNRNFLKNLPSKDYADLLTESYTDYYMPCLSSPYQVALYYAMVCKQMHPRVHIFEDGAATYTEDLPLMIAQSHMHHEVFPKKVRLERNIVEILLRKPELYSVQDEYTITMLPNISLNNDDLVKILRSVFGWEELPKQKYIFFAESYVTEQRNLVGVAMLDRIASIVGKKNIVIRPHPKSTPEELSAFSRHGYSIEEGNVMWEVAALNPDITGKVLVTVSSNAVSTPWSVGNFQVFSLYLWKMNRLRQRRYVELPAFQMYFSKLDRLVNRFHKYQFCPKTGHELNEVIRYIEGETR